MNGCSPSNTSQPGETKSEGTTSTIDQPEKTKKQNSQQTTEIAKEDGTVISFEQIEVKELDPSLNAYQMMYWSEGVETAAYVSIPKANGYYYLSVLCHGGYVIPLDLAGVQSVSGVNLEAESMLSGMQSGIITLSPMYRGYGDSQGTVPGLYGATLDTNNAIDALYSYFKEGNTESSVRSGVISLSGISLGGGVVLKLSQMRNDIDSVIAVNPYVGLNLLYPWATKHPENSWNKGFLDTYHAEFGEYNPTSKQSKEESIELKRSYTPTLIVQGQKDEVMNWELTQTFYESLKIENQNEHTTLELIPEGDHGLTEHQDALNEIRVNWYRQIGTM